MINYLPDVSNHLTQEGIENQLLSNNTIIMISIDSVIDSDSNNTVTLIKPCYKPVTNTLNP